MYVCDILYVIYMCKIFEDLVCVQNILDYIVIVVILGLF